MNFSNVYPFLGIFAALRTSGLIFFTIFVRGLEIRLTNTLPEIKSSILLPITYINPIVVFHQWGYIADHSSPSGSQSDKIKS